MSFQKGDTVTVVDASLITDQNISHPSMVGVASGVKGYSGKSGIITRADPSIGQYFVEFRSLPGGPMEWFDEKWLMPGVAIGSAVTPAVAAATVTPPPVAPQTTPKFKIGDRVRIANENIITNSGDPSHPTVKTWRTIHLRDKKLFGKEGVITQTDTSSKMVHVDIDGIPGHYWFDLAWLTPENQVLIGNQVLIVNNVDLPNYFPFGNPKKDHPDTQRVTLRVRLCDACGGDTFHRLGCPPTSALRNKDF